MPHLTLQVSPLGPLLDLLLGPSQPRMSALKQAGIPLPNPIPIRGLIDTGATCSCIHKVVLAQLGLPPTGRVSIKTPSTEEGAHECDQHDVQVLILHAQKSDYCLRIPTLPIVGVNLPNQGYHALIGRDILARCLFVYDGTANTFSLAF